MNYSIRYTDEFGNDWVRSSFSKDLHKDVLDLFKDQCKVTEVHVEDDGGAYATVANCPTTPNNDMEAQHPQEDK